MLIFSFIKLGKPKKDSELEDKKTLEKDFNNISNDLWRVVGELKERYC